MTSLTTYLSDHLAGATAAIETMAHIERSYPQHEAATIVRRLRPEIEGERDQLTALLEQLGGGSGTARKAVGWIGDRLAQLKLRVDDSPDGTLRLYEMLEMLSLGIEGKHGLWETLDTVATAHEPLRALDYAVLKAHAKIQRAAVERCRLSVASVAFGRRSGESMERSDDGVPGVRP